MAQDKRELLYNNLINSGKVTSAEIGSLDQFRNAIKDEATARQFYQNLMGTGRFQNELGSVDDFYNALSSDFASAQTPQSSLQSFVSKATESLKNVGNQQQTAQQPTQQAPAQAPTQQQVQPKPTSEAPDATIMQGATAPVVNSTIDDMSAERDRRAQAAFDSYSPEAMAARTAEFGENQRKYREQTQLGLGTDNLARGDMKFNPETKKFEQSYITQMGDEFSQQNKAIAKEAQKQQEKEAYNDYRTQTVEEQLNDAKSELERLEKEKKSKGYGLSGTNLYQSSYGAPVHISDDEKQLDASIRQVKDRISTLEEELDEPNFFEKAWKVVTTPRTWDFGISSLADYGTQIQIQQKLDKGIALNESEKNLLKQAYETQQVREKYRENDSFWNRAGEITGNMLPFVLEFVLTRGYGSFARGGRALGVSLARQAGTRGGTLANKVIRYTGIAAGDLAAAGGMALTTGAPKTASNILERHLGNIQKTDNGFEFVGGEDWGSAAYKGLISNTLEYYTEMLGGHLGLVEKYAGKLAGATSRTLGKGFDSVGLHGLKKFGLDTMSDIYSRITLSQFNKKFQKGLKDVAINDVLGEGLEEEANIILNAALVGDNKFSDLFDPKTQLDIWGGMALSIGFMKTPGWVEGGRQSAGYYAYRTAMNDASRKAENLFATETWKIIKDEIDNSENKDVTDILYDVVEGRGFSKEQKEAIFYYTDSLLKFRGYNLGTMAAAREEQSTGQPVSNPRVSHTAIDGKTLIEYDEKGNEIRRTDYDTEEDAQAANVAVLDKRDNDDMLADYEVLNQVDPEQAQAVFNDFAQRFEMTPERVMEIMQTDPFARTEDEVILANMLAQALHEAAYPDGVAHPEQSFQDGQKTADETPLEPVQPVEISSQPTSQQAQLDALQQQAAESQQALDAYLNTHDDIREATRGMNPIEAIDYIQNNFSGSERDEAIALYANVLNASTKLNGYQLRMQGKVDEYINNEVQSRTFKGTINGQPIAEDGIYTINDGSQEYTLVHGNIAMTPEGRVDPDASEESVLALDSDGTFQRIKTSGIMTVTQGSMQAFADNLRAQYTPVSPEAAAAPATADEGATTQSEQAGEEAGAPATGANESPAAASPETQAEVPANVQGGQQTIESVTDKDGVKRYEQGISVDDAIADMVQDGLDVNEEANLAINEAQEELDKIKAPKTRAERVKNEARRRELQNTIDYYNNVKARWEEVQQAEVPTESEENINVQPEQPSISEKPVSLQQKIAGERPKARTADEERAERVRRLKEEYGDDYDDDFTKAQSAEELAAMYVGRNRTLSREDLARELGYKLGINTEEPWAETLLAKKGEGKSLWAVAHAAYESDENPIIDNEGTKKFTDQEIHDALLDLFRGSKKKSDIMDYVVNSREEMAKRNREGRLRAEEEAKERGEEQVTLTDEELEQINANKPFLTLEEENPEEYAWLESLFDGEKYKNAIENEQSTASDGLVHESQQRGTDRTVGEGEQGNIREQPDSSAAAGENQQEGGPNPATEERADTSSQPSDTVVLGQPSDSSIGGGLQAGQAQDYLNPRNAEEEAIVQNVINQLQQEIQSAVEDVDKARADLEKARARESNRATDLFANDKAFAEPDAIFSQEEMGLDTSAEGVERRTRAERENLQEAVNKLNQLQSIEERNSRIRGALDNHRRQTSFEGVEERQQKEYDEYIKPLLNRSDEELEQLAKRKEDAVGGDLNKLAGDLEYSAIKNVQAQRELDRQRKDAKVFIANTIDDDDVTFVDKATPKEIDKLNSLIDEYGVDDSEGKIEDYVKQLRKKYHVNKSIEGKFELKEGAPDDDLAEGAKPYDVFYNGEQIGVLALSDNGKDVTVRGIRFDDKYRNRGLGKKLYKYLNKKANENGGVLYSDFDNTSESATRVWDSLVREGVAEQIPYGYRFKPLNALETAQQAKKEYEEKTAPEATEKLNNSNTEDTTVNEHKENLQSENNSVDLQGDSAEFADRQQKIDGLSKDINEALYNAVMKGDIKLKTMQGVKVLAKEYGLDDISLTDLQELVEAEIVNVARDIASTDALNDEQKFEHIKHLYEWQPTLSARDNDRINKQQYSTPAPMAFLMGRFVDPQHKAESGLEPSAGNGMLTIYLPKEKMHVNDIDEMRLSNLEKQGFGKVTSQDGLQPFGEKAYDVVVTNPPFGSTEPKDYDGYEISGLEHQMAINALESMKDDGRAAIIVGGNTEYKDNGAIKGKDRAFLNYLYSHYNVVDVINCNGKTLYYRQGQSTPVRIILINGRKQNPNAFDFAPVKSKARAEQVKSYEELYNRINDDILSDRNKPAGVQQAESGQSRGVDDSGHAGTSAETGVRDVQPEGGSRKSESLAGNGKRVQRGDTATNNRTDSEANQELGGGLSNVGGGAESSEPGRAAASQTNGGRERVSERRDNAEQPNGGVDVPVGGGSRPSVEVRRLGTEKVPYIQQSRNPYALQSQMPAEQAEVVKKSLENIGDVDAFLANELGYSSVEDMYHGSQSPEKHGGLSAEQIDSVALAIHQMNQGNAFIIGDQTGVGKGRQGAALIRYAVKKGTNPVYITKKKDLFSDMYRDLCDIGSPELKPFIWAADDKNHSADITDKDGNVVYKRPNDKEQKRVVDYINEHGKLPPEYDYIITTYDSFTSGTMDYVNGKKKARSFGKKQPGTGAFNGQAKRDALEKLAENSYVLMDESHTAGGEGSNISGYLQYITSKAKGLTFLSATFAKRPGNMPIYSLRTAISKAGVKVEELIDAVKRGGATFQEIMSKALTEAGQMIRRERDMRGVTIDWKGIDDEAVVQQQREQYDKIIGLFNDIINFQRTYVDPIIDKMNDDAADLQGSVDHTPGTRDMGINNTPFASRTYNMVQQVLLSLKAEETAKRAIEHLKAGRKPVIALSNTNEGAADIASTGEDMEMPDLGVNLKKGLQGTLRIQKTDDKGNKTQSVIPFDALGEEGKKRYQEIMDAIDNSSSGLSLSPIDTMKNVLKKAGYKVGELTGRQQEFVYNEDGTVKRVKRQDTDKKRTAADFNNGNIDALIINRSAGTGISLHSSTKFRDQRQRIMLVAQAQPDVNDEVQMRGRIDRTGQITRGMYEYVVSQIPSEQRLLMMLKAKLRSLDANTTSSQKSKFNEMQVQDIINKYGDQIVIQYLAEHPDFAAKMCDPLKWRDNVGEGYETTPAETLIANASKVGEDGATASKVLGRMALLKVKEQEQMLNDITTLYQTEIDRLNEMGENDLEITEMPLKAKTLKKDVWEEGIEPGGNNPFADNSYVEEVEMDVLKKPMKAEEVKKAQTRLLGGKTWEEYKQSVLDGAEKWAENKKEETTKTITERSEKKAAAEKERYIKGAKKVQEKSGMTDEEIERNGQFQYDNVYKEEMGKLQPAIDGIEKQQQTFIDALDTFSTDGVYAFPTDIYDLSQLTFDPSFGKVIDINIADNYSTAASTITFATLDGRRKITIPISGMVKQQNGEKKNIIPHIVQQTAQARNGFFGTNISNTFKVLGQNIDNWDKLTSTAARKKGYIITGNLLKALTELRKQGQGGKLISYTTDTGDIRQGILMGDRFDPGELTSKNPISSVKAALDSGGIVVSSDGDIALEKTTGIDWTHTKPGRHTEWMYKLYVPKSKKRGAKYFNDETLLSLMDGQFEGSTRLYADFPQRNLDAVLKRLDELGVTVREERKDNSLDSGYSEQTEEDYLEDVNTLYNERLDELEKDPEQKDRVLHLGHPGSYLKEAGIDDGEILMDYDKFVRKSSEDYKNKHPFEANDIKNLPQAINHPIAVFDSSNQNNDKVILTELKKDGKNFIVAIRATTQNRKGGLVLEVNEITTLYPKNAKGIVKWILDKTFTLVDKNKALRWIEALRPHVGTTISSEELDDAAKIIQDTEKNKDSGNFNTSLSSKDKNTAENLSSKDKNTAKKQSKSHIRNRINITLRKLGTKDRTTVYSSLDEVEDPKQRRHIEQMHRQGKKVYGWFKGGKVFLYLPDIDSEYKAEQTIWHETVGHVGLRNLIGDENYKRLLYTIWKNNNDSDMVDWVTRRMQENGWEFYKAMDEWLAREAEKTIAEKQSRKTLWQKITGWLADTLKSIGYRFAPNINDTRYLFWLSQNHIAPTNPISEAKRNALLRKLENDAPTVEIRDGKFVEFGEEDGNLDSGYSEDVDTPSKKTASYQYERALSDFGYVWKEAHVDAMQSAIELAKSVAGVKDIVDIPAHENFIWDENQLSSKEADWNYRFNRDFVEPVDEIISKILPDLGRRRKEAFRKLQLYMIQKHGLERNRVLFVRDALRAMRMEEANGKLAPGMTEQAEDHWERQRDSFFADLNDGTIDLREYFEKLDELIRDTFDPSYKAAEHDYSGLTSIEPGINGTYDDAMVIDEVMNTESMLAEPDGSNKRLEELWNRTNALSDYSLEMEYEAGFIDKKTFDHVSSMFNWYVPLRGYDETTAEEVYDYLEDNNKKDYVGPALKNARGRKSLADADVIATLGTMGTNAIHRHLVNKMKTSFARFVRANKSDLVTELGFAWAEKVGTNPYGEPIWKEVQPDIPENATGDEVSDILDQFEQRMRQEQANGNARRIRKGDGIKYKFIDREHKNQHIVEAWIGGDRRQFIINGNPRAAQAINGRLKAHRRSNFLGLSSLSHFISGMVTSYSPDFILRNTERDATFASFSIISKESPRYVLKWKKNYLRMIGRMAYGTPIDGTNLFSRYRKDELNPNNKTDMYFKEFMENGGKTGWVEQKNKDKWKELVQESLMAKSQNSFEKVSKKILLALPHLVEHLNERAENMARFATYMTSREMGRSIKRSVSDAKEVSVNFNRKGAGANASSINKNNSGAMRVNAFLAGWSAQYLQDYKMFYNAGIQAMNVFAKIMGKHPVAGTLGLSTVMLSGFLIPILNAALAGDDDDKDKNVPKNPYEELPEWLRRNNLCIYLDNGTFLTIPLSIELRAFYGLGDMAAGLLLNPKLKSEKSIMEQIVSQLTQITPLDFMGEHGGKWEWLFAPSGAVPLLEAKENVNWQGVPIERNDAYLKENTPRWTLAYKSVNDLYLGLAKWLTAKTNDKPDEYYKKAGYKDEDIFEADALRRGFIDIDPAQVQHVVEGYFGGMGSTVANLAYLTKSLWNGDEIRSNRIPLYRTQVYKPTEQNRYYRARNRYFDVYKPEMEAFKEEMSKLRKDSISDPLSKIMQYSKEDSLMAVRAQIMDDSYKDYKKLKEALENANELEKKDSIQLEMDKLMQSTVETLDAIR